MTVKRHFISRVLIKNHMFHSVNVNFYTLESQATDDSEYFGSCRAWSLSYMSCLSPFERGRLYPCMVLLQMLQSNKRKAEGWISLEQ